MRGKCYSGKVPVSRDCTHFRPAITTVGTAKTENGGNLPFARSEHGRESRRCPASPCELCSLVAFLAGVGRAPGRRRNPLSSRHLRLLSSLSVRRGHGPVMACSRVNSRTLAVHSVTGYFRVSRCTDNTAPLLHKTAFLRPRGRFVVQRNKDNRTLAPDGRAFLGIGQLDPAYREQFTPAVRGSVRLVDGFPCESFGEFSCF